MAGTADKYTAVREALRTESSLWHIEHCDITCDGCECEPIIGRRYKCTVCEDIDLCDACMRALVAARIKMAQEAAPLPAPRQQGRRPRKWVSKLHSRDLSERWAALQTAVPCLHPSHQFLRILDGPERAVVFTPGRSSSAAAEEARKQQQQQQQQQQQHLQQRQHNGSAEIQEGFGRLSLGDGSGRDAALDEFLATFRPSVSSCRDVAWIVVAHPQDSNQQQAAGAEQQAGGSIEERVDAAVEEWEQVVAAAKKAGRRITAADVDALAVKHRILKGKWMLFARSGAEADAAWAAVARAVCGGQQQRGGAPLCGSAKVSSAGPEGDNSWVICCYTDNYTDDGDLQRVCQGLQQAVPPGLLQDKRLLYKPDIYTHLGIYSKNEWQLKPTVREARLR